MFFYCLSSPPQYMVGPSRATPVIEAVTALLNNTYNETCYPVPYHIHGGVMEAIFSKSLKAGDRTYFIDIKEAKNKTKYLSISESRPSKDGEKKFTRSSVMVF